MTIDIDYIRQRIDEMRKECGGIEPRPRPPGFVSEAMAIKLTNKCRPLVAFLTEYTKLCDEANEILDISAEHTKWIDGFATDIALLDHVEDVHAHKYRGNSFRLRWIIQTIKARKSYASINDYITKIFVLLKGVKMFDYKEVQTDISEEDYQVLYGKLQEVNNDEQQSITKAGVAQ